MRPPASPSSRRHFLRGSLGLAGLGLLAGCGVLPNLAQPSRLSRIGYLHAGLSSARSYLEAFQSGLRDLGYVEGTNLAIEYRFAEGDTSRLPGLASELVDLRLEAIVTHAQGVTAARRATPTIPIVMLAFADAVAIGLIDSLAHPGGNITGSTAFTAELVAKRLELLKEVEPAMTEAAFLINPDYPVNGPIVEAIKTTADALGVGLQTFDARVVDDFERAFATMAEHGLSALVLHDDPLFVFNADLCAALATKHHLAAIGSLEFARAGGMIAYGVDFRGMYRRAAYFVDRILKGARPADLPVERPTTFQLLANLKTARALGLTVPPSVLQQSTELIQ